MLVTGAMERSMGAASICGSMELGMRASMRMGANKVTVSSCTTMETAMKAPC